MKKIMPGIICLCLLPILTLGCGAKGPLDPKNPVTLTMWHNFGGEMQRAIDPLIDEFNATLGKERGIIVSVEAITASVNLQNTMNMIVAGDPGAPAMPDIVTVYPKTAVLLRGKGLLANLEDYFTVDELAAYIPAFVDEGRFDGGLYVFPFAKSTELLFVNQTFFDRFAADTGVTMDCFKTFEGIADAAMKYYEWTNARTPDIPRDHRQFFTADSWLNLAQAGMVQQGKNLFEGESLALDRPEYRRVWETFYAPAVTGGFTVYEGYSSDLAKTGDIICSTGSSAGILYYSNTVTYPDNRTEQVEYSILPYPVFEGGKKAVIQRGSGLVVSKSDKTHETAAALFLKWLTAPEQNIRLVAETGYLPVTQAAFETYMPSRIASAQNPLVRKMLNSITIMYGEYDFFTAPALPRFDTISRNYEQHYKALLIKDRETYLNNGGMNQDDSLAAFAAELKKQR